MTIEIHDDRFTSIVDQTVSLNVVGSNFDFIEGPIWNHIDNHLIFSDMPGNKMRKWTSENGIEIFREPSNMANGNAYDNQGRLVTCEHATSRVTRTEKDGTISILASKYNNKELNSPNDIIVSSNNTIYFTDPSFGRMEYYGVPREPELDYRGVYRIDPDGTLTLLADDFDQPNGLCLSMDESKLFVNDTMRNHIRVFDISSNGSLINGNVWATLKGTEDGVADGMKIDSNQNLYSCGPGGIHVFNSDSTLLGIIKTPEHVANFIWGEKDLKTLFITASTSLYSIPVKTPGLPAF
ncbi:MAG: gluconolactonase [Chloroflexi bacterium]|nr:gluconolactonase [Chloroflexota bacterium]MQG04984.1 SMP-30/gluconolactonase/LRE family protein [SAR202 cluster bacterium]|tara:strand:- start:400 stop:1284 length:885 start_codon:yes stop_codon:yes gene_type:complete